jgi:molecular chaperone GrpE
VLWVGVFEASLTRQALKTRNLDRSSEILLQESAMNQPKPNESGVKPATEHEPEGPAEESTSLSELNSLKAKLATVEKDREELLRHMADLDNQRKRAIRDAEQERRFAFTPLARDLLVPLDNLERAITAAKQTGDAGTLVQGVSATYSQILDVLKRHGIVRMNAEGAAFDPNIHEAVMQQPSSEHSPGTIIKVLQQGFMFHDRVLRPASVVVAVSPS